MSPLRFGFPPRACLHWYSSMKSLSAFQRRLSLRLAAWSAASLAGGAALILWGGTPARGAGIQAVAWGAAEAGLALAWLLGSRRALPQRARACGWPFGCTWAWTCCAWPRPWS